MLQQRLRSFCGRTNERIREGIFRVGFVARVVLYASRMPVRINSPIFVPLLTTFALRFSNVEQIKTLKTGVAKLLETGYV